MAPSTPRGRAFPRWLRSSAAGSTPSRLHRPRACSRPTRTYPSARRPPAATAPCHGHAYAALRGPFFRGPLRRLQLDSHDGPRRLGVSAQRGKAWLRGPALEACDARLAGPHSLGDLRLGESRTRPRFDELACQRELLLERVVALLEPGLLHPALRDALQRDTHHFNSPRVAARPREHAAASSASSSRRHGPGLPLAHGGHADGF